MKLVIPWFAVYFIGVAGFNSLHLVPQNIVDIINEIDTFLTYHGYDSVGNGNTVFAKFKGLGLAPSILLLLCLYGSLWVGLLSPNWFVRNIH